MNIKTSFKIAACLGFIFAPLNAIAQEVLSSNSEAIISEDNYSNPIKIAAVSQKANFTNGLIKNNPSELNRLAARFIGFVNETQNAAKDESLSNAENIANFVDNSPVLTRADTIDGAKALAIISASQSKEFVENVKNIANFMGSEVLIQKLKENPQLVKTIKGYEDAQSRANFSLETAFSKIDKSSAIIAQAAYDLQKQKWSIIASDKQPRLEATQVSWNKTINLNEADFSKISEFLNLETTNSNSTLINDKLIIAAVILTLSNEEAALSHINMNSGKFCANNAYLNLRMCISATKYPYEHTFCLAKHAYSEFEACAKAATK